MTFVKRHPADIHGISAAGLVLLLCRVGIGDKSRTTTIFAADEDIQEGQLIVFLLLHRKFDVREDGVELFFERQHLIPFDDYEGVIHIPSPKFRSVVSENQRLQPL
nr:unnamed protein product [Spirometra erinaceieuropaei]